MIVLFLCLYFFKSYSNPVDEPRITPNANVSEARYCYKTIFGSRAFIGITLNPKFPNPPKLISGLFFIYVMKDKEYIAATGRWIYLRLIDDRCNETFWFSSANRTYDFMSIKLDIYIGHRSLLLSTISAVMHPGFQQGVYLFEDAFDILKVYFEYRIYQNTVHQSASQLRLASYIRLTKPEDFDSEYICVAKATNHFIIKPEYVSRSTPPLPYYGIDLRIFFNDTHYDKYRYPAWPCYNSTQELASKVFVLPNPIDDVIYDVFTFLLLDDRIRQEPINHRRDLLNHHIFRISRRLIRTTIGRGHRINHPDYIFLYELPSNYWICPDRTRFIQNYTEPGRINVFSARKGLFYFNPFLKLYKYKLDTNVQACPNNPGVEEDLAYADYDLY